MSSTLPELPPLPEPNHRSMMYPTGVGRPYFDAEKMHAYATAYAQACVVAEREAAAKSCESMASSETDWDTSNWNQAVERCAAAIRARKP
jgi:hypothetical protein